MNASLREGSLLDAVGFIVDGLEIEVNVGKTDFGEGFFGPFFEVIKAALV